MKNSFFGEKKDQKEEVENWKQNKNRKFNYPESSSDDDVETNNTSTEETIHLDEEESKKKSKVLIDYVSYVVYFLFWATLYAIAIKLKFGAVYFIISCLIAMYLNTRTDKKKEGEMSAYSVFNTNLESIDGTLKAEQLERQFGIRA